MTDEKKAYLRRQSYQYDQVYTDRVASAADMLDEMRELAKDLHYRLNVIGDRCSECGQHTFEAKSSYQAQKQVSSIVRQVERLAAMEAAGLLPWKEGDGL